MGELIQMKAGKINIKDIKKKINKSMGMEAAFDLRESNPTEVVDWIPTGSRWLDSSICKGKMGGIPVYRNFNDRISRQSVSIYLGLNSSNCL